MINNPKKKTKGHIIGDMPNSFYRTHAIKTMQDVTRVLMHPIMRNMYELICRQEVSVTDIYVILRVEQSVVSQYLRILRAAKMVTTRREGKYIFYRHNKKTWNYIDAFLNDIA